MNKTLTAKQNAQVEQNMALVTWTINRYLPYFNGDEDVFQEGCIGLCKAAIAFDESKGAFSTLAVKCILRQLYKRGRYMKEVPQKSFAPAYLVNEEGEESSIFDKIVDNTSVEDTALDNVEFQRFITDRQKQIIRYLWQGLNQHQIAKQIGVSQACVSRDITKAVAY